MADKILIFDGTNTFLRNFVVNPHADINGNPIGGFLGTLRSIKYMIRETSADRVFFVWDGPGGAQRRRGVISDYKMGRKPRLNREFEEGVKTSSDNMYWQKEKLKTFLGFLGVTQIEVPNIEADDTIGYLVGALEPSQKVVVSSDKDMWQLISDTTIVYWPTKKVFISKETFKDYSEFHPENFVLVRALSGAGDASDNISGIKGLGTKTIAKIFPSLKITPTTLDQLLSECKILSGENSHATVTQKRWTKVILENENIVRDNIQVMQLSEPNISAASAAVIRNAICSESHFNVTGFKLALINNNIQLTDQDFFSTFQSYKLRAQHVATQ